ncbi:unnamed protein product [Ixodes pacificus]
MVRDKTPLDKPSVVSQRLYRPLFSSIRVTFTMFRDEHMPTSPVILSIESGVGRDATISRQTRNTTSFSSSLGNSLAISTPLSRRPDDNIDSVALSSVGRGNVTSLQTDRNKGRVIALHSRCELLYDYDTSDHRGKRSSYTA